MALFNIKEVIDAQIYEKTVLAKNCPSKWNFNLVFAQKPVQK